MTVKKILGLSLTILVFTLGVLKEVSAASLSVKCETRGTTRSKISVDGAGLTGVFYAIVYSPPSVAVRSKLPNKRTDINHQVEFDFDSNPSDIAAGATKISPTFIKNRTVYGFLRRSSDNQQVAAMKAPCSAK